jgi:putative ABC transport system permease protein
MLETARHDIRYALRGLRRAPAFTVAALVTLVIGTGATTAIFSVVYGVLLRPLPLPRADELVMLPVRSTTPARSGFDTGGAVSPAGFLDWQSRGRAFRDMAAFTNISQTLTGRGEPALLTAAAVTVRFFDTLQVQAAHGRTFSAEEGQPGRDRVAVLSDDLWRRRFAADPAIIGTAITLNGEPFTVVGVMPSGFSFPEEVLGPPGRYRSIQTVDLWTPFVPDPSSRGNLFLRMIARLQPSTTLAQAQAAMRTAAQDLATTQPRYRTLEAVVVPLHEYVVGDVRRLLLLFSGGVAFVLLIACVNVANLLVARAAARQKEVAMRAALGAGGGRLVRQFLTESAVLGTIGGLGGVALATASLQAFVAVIPRGGIPRLSEISIDGHVLAFTLIVSLLAGLAFGLAPVLYTRRTSVAAAIKGNAATQTPRLGLLHILVASEVAAAVILLVGASLLITSFSRLISVEPGFGHANVMTASVTLPPGKYTTTVQTNALHRRVLERIAQAPGVTSAAAINWLPFGGNALTGDIIAESGPLPPDLVPVKAAVSPGYFRTMNIPLLAGRPFSTSDSSDGQPVVIVTRRLAQQVWGDRGALGQRLKLGFGRPEDQPWATVVGIVNDVKQNALSEADMPAVYTPLAQAPVPFLLDSMTFVARTDADMGRLEPLLRAAVHAADPELPINRMASVETLVAMSVAEPRFRTLLFGAFAAVALALAITGLLGVLTYSVIRRTKEIGVRVALGATPGAVARLVVRQSLAVTTAGLVAGLAGAFGLTQALSGFLFDIEPTDPGVFTLVAATLVLTALVVSYLPARRATRVDPIVAMDHE